jgi:photosystem II stability/assembly factor-like uncharacterized protein
MVDCRTIPRASADRVRAAATWVVCGLVAVLASACSWSQSAEPPGANGQAVEGGILPAEEDYYAVDVLDADHAWMVGSYGAVIQLRDKGHTAALLPAPEREPLFAVSFRDASTGVLGGRGGRVFRTTDGGQSWSVAATADAKDNVLGLARGRNRQLMWAVGPGGMVVHSTDDGATWEDQSLKKDITLNAVTFIDDQEGWIVGEFGSILHTVDGGKTWQWSDKVEGLPPYAEDVTEEVALRVGIPPLDKYDLYLFDVAFVTPETGYIVAAGGFVLKTVDRGKHWTAVRAGTRNTLFNIVPAPSGGLVTTGVLGTVAHERGDHWTVDEAISHKLFTWIRGMSFSADGALGVAVGGKAAVLLSQDRGETWERLPREKLAAAGSNHSS